MSCLSHSYTDVFKDLCDGLGTVLDIRHSINQHIEASFIIYLFSFHVIRLYIFGTIRVGFI
jgi:hypothetical protein